MFNLESKVEAETRLIHRELAMAVSLMSELGYDSSSNWAWFECKDVWLNVAKALPASTNLTYCIQSFEAYKKEEQQKPMRSLYNLIYRELEKALSKVQESMMQFPHDPTWLERIKEEFA